MIIDTYSHVCPEPLLDAMSRRFPGAEVAALRKNSYLFDGERRLRYMDRIGVDQLALVLVRPPMWVGMPRSLVHESLGLPKPDLTSVLSGNALRRVRRQAGPTTSRRSPC